ncbi:MAG: sporadic carbohydrate cluster protein, LIC12192 family [Gammaproteobacteria bacterium]|nr:sporadic carbohydrate cluster protein, LIC12192 family [Gammaproteobacteria bacterium]
MNTAKGYRGYVSSRPFMEERVPQHIQNIVIRDYCKKNNLLFLLSATEYAMDETYLMLAQLMKNLERIEGIVFYSLFQLPEETEKREDFFMRSINLSKEIHFAVESLSLKNKDDYIRLENIWKVKKIINLCPKEINYI